MIPAPLIYQAERARVCLALTCGLPGAGKTSLCKAIQASSKADTSVRHICFDDIVDFNSFEDEGKDFRNPEAFKASRHHALHHIEQYMLECAEDAHHRPTLILADDNMYYRSMRYECAQLARLHDAAFMQLYLPCSLDKALARNAQRTGSDRIPVEVIRRMAERLEEPDGQRHEWEQNTVTLPSESIPSLDDTQGWVGIRDKLLASWRAPLPPALHPQQQGPPTEASASTAHGLDLQLRRMLADAVASIAGAASKADAARQLNGERKQLLARVCRGGRVTSSEEALQGILKAFRDLCHRTGRDAPELGSKGVTLMPWWATA